MADGSTKAIEKVRIGDLVLAADPSVGLTAAQPVSDLITGGGDKPIVRVGTDIDRDAHLDWISATSEHPFYVAGRGWTNADSLDVGDLLVDEWGNLVPVRALESSVQRTEVHNLTVTVLHTYFVVVGDARILVHNASCFNSDQRALVDLAKENARGVSKRDAETLVGWAKEYGVPNHGVRIDRTLPPTNKWYRVVHIKINRTHIRAR